MSAHAVLAPSGASQWSSCFAAPAMQLGMPESSSEHAAEGTAMHEVGELALSTEGDVFDMVGQSFLGDKSKDLWFELTAESAKTLNNGYIIPVRQLAEGYTLLVEERLPISHITGEKDARGTSDTVILAPRLLIIADLKWGMGVQVDAEENEQLVMYALAAYEQYRLVHEFDEVLLIVFQPRLDHISEWRIPLSQLLEIGERLKQAAKVATDLMTFAMINGEDAIPLNMFKPSEDNCRWCKRKTTCDAARNHVLSNVFDDFDVEVPLEEMLTSERFEKAIVEVRKKDNDKIAFLMGVVGMIQAWCKAVIAHGEAEIHAGRTVPGYKLVMGKQGNRAWTFEDAAAHALRSLEFKPDQIYEHKLISPTAAEKLFNGKKDERWEKMKAYITRSPASPTVVPESDKRPAIEVKRVEDEFEDETFEDLV